MAFLVPDGGREGQAAASGKTGRSARRIDQSVMGQFARNIATQEASLRSAQEASSFRTDKLQDQLKIANYRAWAPVAVGLQQPMELPKPQQVSGPSGMSLATGIGGALLDGASSMFSINSQLG